MWKKYKLKQLFSKNLIQFICTCYGFLMNFLHQKFKSSFSSRILEFVFLRFWCRGVNNPLYMANFLGAPLSAPQAKKGSKHITTPDRGCAENIRTVATLQTDHHHSISFETFSWCNKLAHIFETPPPPLLNFELEFHSFFALLENALCVVVLLWNLIFIHSHLKYFIYHLHDINQNIYAYVAS